MRRLRRTIATTHVDRHGDEFALGVLEDMAEEVATRCVPVLYNHDPRVPPLGRTLSAEVVQLRDGEHALVAEWELFEPRDVAPPVDLNRQIGLRELADDIVLEVDRSYRHESDRKVLSQLEAQGVTISQMGKKALEPISVLTIAVSLVAGGFLAKAGADLWDLLWSGVRKLLSHRRQTDAEFLLILELQLRTIPKPLFVCVILDSPNDRDVESIMATLERMMRAVAPHLLALDQEVVKVVLHYENGKLRPGYVIRSDGYPGMLTELDSGE